MSSLKFLNHYLIRYKYKIYIGCFFIVLSNIFALFPVNLIGRTFDLIVEKIDTFYLTNHIDFKSLYSILLVYVVLLIFFALLKGLFMFFMRQNIIVVSREIEYELKNDIFCHYQKLSSFFYKNHDIGDLLNRLTEDVSRVRMYLGPALMYSFNLLTLIILVLTRMISIHPWLSFLVLAPLPLLSFLIYLVSNKINYKSKAAQNKLSKLTNVVQETFSGIRLVKSFVRESKIIDRFNKSSNNYMLEYISLSKTNSIFFPLVLLLVGLSTIVTIYVGGLLYIRGDISLGEITEFLIYVNMLTWPVTSVGWVTEVIQRAAASQTRINEFLTNKNFSQFHRFSLNPKLEDFIINISCKNLSLQYQEGFSVNNVNLNILNKSMVAFVGGVGSGKTTLIKILAGILPASKGDLLFNDILFSHLNSNSFREYIAYVPQNPFLFSDTIKNNILFGNENATDQRILYLLEKLCILDEVKSFKNHLNTHVGEGGITLSGGQKQRICLVRALVKNPKLLILDDALSSVDSDTEFSIIKFIKTEYSNCTIILTSNRLSVLEHCDNIFVMSNGRIVQSGTPNKLINESGVYYNLFASQLSYSN